MLLGTLDSLHLPSQPHLAVAVSGGADSMALAILAKKWVEERGGRITALHVDHRLRAESKDEAILTQQRLAVIEIPCEVLVWEHEPITTALQERARDARYSLMNDWCKAQNVNHLLIAHHADDQAETIAFRLWRGAGIEGLAGMRSLRTLTDCTLVRPLLNIPKSTLVELLREKHIEWVEDASNHNLAYDRVKIRVMLKNNPELTPRLLAFGNHMARARDAIEETVANFLATHATLEETRASVDAKALMALPFDYRWRVISTLIARYSTKPEPPRFYQLEALANELPTKTTLGGVILKRTKDRLVLTLEK